MKSVGSGVMLFAGLAIAFGAAGKEHPKLFMELPATFNSPASATVGEDGNIYFTSPNFHNDALVKAGDMKEPAAPAIGKIDQNNAFSTWYVFKPEDMEKTSGKVAPFGIAFGPDGNAYVADMQLWFGGKSRILRINVENGQAVDVDVVATGIVFPNALVWKGSDLFISDTVLKAGEGRTVSGNYKVALGELNAEMPLEIKPYVDAENHDPHLLETFVSNGKLGFGANGLAFDGEGNLYTSIMEDGSVRKTVLDGHNHAKESVLFAEGMIATDGMKWDRRTNKLYVADLFANAVYSVDMEGNLALIAQNGNTDGSNGLLDAPSEVVVRGKDMVVMNFDASFDSPEMTNKQPDKPHTLSVIELK